MSFRILVGGLLLWLLHPVGLAQAQELEPGAFSPSPVGANIVVVADTFKSGSISLDPTLPISEAHANINVSAAGYVRTLDFFGRSASVGFLQPYVHGNFSGVILGQDLTAHRSAFADPGLRFAVNLYGAPAMTPQEFVTYVPQNILGFSLAVVPPLGAYNGTELVNVGYNRWAFKPQFGFSHWTGPWTFEADLGSWFFTDNNDFFRGKVRSESPIASLEVNAIYTFRPRMWLSLDATYYTGGRSTINGKPNFDLEQNSLAGITFALPITRRQSVKFTGSRVIRSTIGGEWSSFGITYQFVWIDRR
jgi:Putative MetA-pathway of phenol degradation